MTSPGHRAQRRARAWRGRRHAWWRAQGRLPVHALNAPREETVRAAPPLRVAPASVAVKSPPAAADAWAGAAAALGDLAGSRPARRLKPMTHPADSMASPPHPGLVLRRDFLVPRGLSQAVLARLMEVAPQSLNAVVRGRRAVSVPMARKLAGALDTAPEYWMDLQRDHDLHGEAEEISAAC
jgi:addiction module HigA family antidote